MTETFSPDNIAFLKSHLTDILSRWLAAADRPDGLFHAALDRQWQPVGKTVGTLVSQSRLLYNFAIGYQVTGQEAYLDAVRRGSHCLLDRFFDGQNGGWNWSAGPDGVEDDSKNAYGHAFVIFGLSHAWTVTKEPVLLEAAIETIKVMETSFRDRLGGYRWYLTNDFRDAKDVRSQNPMMHLFEALLALSRVEGAEDFALAQAEELAEWIFTELFRPGEGCLPERYTLQWQPLEADPDGSVDVGHQFEWAYLLSRAVEAGLGQQYLQTAGRLLEYGLKHGLDATGGGIYSNASFDGTITHPAKSWWQQAEAARALLHHAVRRGRDDCRAPFDLMMEFIRGKMVDPEYGGWFQTYPADERAMNKGSAWKVDYHVTGLCHEPVRLGL